jgi:hypothetical protein
MATASNPVRRPHLRLVTSSEEVTPVLTTIEPTSHRSSHPSSHPSAGHASRPAFDDLDAEFRLLEAIARRATPSGEVQVRTLTVWARGQLADGRVLWAGTGGVWGVIEPILAELLGWNADSPRPVRADIHSADGRHEVLAVHTLRRIDVA